MILKFKGRLTPHFTSEEYCTGNTSDCILTEESYTFAQILEKTRVEVGLRFYVNSWYRSAKLNKKLGGITSSNHLRGCACDFHLSNKVTRKKFITIVNIFKKHCKAAGLVAEAGLYNDFIHLGIQNETQKAVNGYKFIQWDGRTGTLIYNNILEVLD